MRVTPPPAELALRQNFFCLTPGAWPCGRPKSGPQGRMLHVASGQVNDPPMGGMFFDDHPTGTCPMRLSSSRMNRSTQTSGLLPFLRLSRG
jgi:hypothetical protein